jgi:beta-phosphoglucomutase-like phosphatase (HAD superfamily)
VFEDSFNGLKSGRASGAVVVGLSTSNSEEAIKEYCDIVIPNYKGIDYNILLKRINEK